MNDLFLIFAVAFLTVTLGLWWLLRPRQSSHTAAPADVPSILVRNDLIEHASEAALARLPIAIGLHDWSDLYEILSPHYPDFPGTQLQDGSAETVVSGPSDEMRISWQKNGAVITFHGKAGAGIMAPDLEELELLREVNDSLPFPAWKTDSSGTIDWYNNAYAALKKLLPREIGSDDVFDISQIGEGSNTARIKIKLEGQANPEWYSVTRKPTHNGAIFHATSLTTLISAEEAQREFVQTLAKTFAHLSTGLAIFNRNRQLALFNPALTDLTGLSASFLSPRPTIDSFFDAMRENRRMPEPKNYKTWRQRMADLISAAETGRFEETWTLETGQTYRVTGRPHPDGAIAFLIEDISAEISLTRNFRAELELGQSLVDTFEDALAVFSQNGVLTFSNKAYDLLWGFENNTSFADVTITDAIQLWKEKTAPNPLWQDLQDAVMNIENRDEWDMPVCIKGQKPMHCKVVPIASGATVVRFSYHKGTLTKGQQVLGNARD